MKPGDVFHLESDGGRISLSSEGHPERTVATIFPVRIFDAEDSRDVTAEFEVREHVADLHGGLFRRMFRVANTANQTRTVKIVLEAETGFVPSHWLIPCVMYNGNSFGKLDSPRGIERDGKPWVFAYDRSGIPSCTLSETRTAAFACFASDRDPDRQRVVARRGGTDLDQRRPMRRRAGRLEFSRDDASGRLPERVFFPDPLDQIPVIPGTPRTPERFSGILAPLLQTLRHRTGRGKGPGSAVNVNKPESVKKNRKKVG